MKLRGAWRRDYSEFFDTQEALLIDAMDNADSIYTVFARLQSLAVKCGCAGKLLLHESVPYTDEMLAAVTKKTVPAFRQCMQPLVQLGLVICEDGIYAIADWEFNQNVPAIDAMREGGKVLELMRTCAGETEYLIHYPDEIIRSDESEAAFIQMTNESDGTLMLVCDIDGELVGFCSLNCAGMKKSKVRHRASVGISVISKYWGKGLGTIMMSAWYREKSQDLRL